jgi:hypothetical protein
MKVKNQAIESGLADSILFQSNLTALGCLQAKTFVTALAACADLSAAVGGAALHANPLLQEASFGLGKALSHTSAPT